MKPSSCSGCPLESHGQDFSQLEGLGRIGVMCIAEASGEAEARDQLALRPYAPSGGIYERTLRRLGMDRDQFVTTNAIRCRPRENLLEGMYYEDQALAHCKPNLLAALAKHKPRVLVAFGNVALRSLTGWQGEKCGVSHLRGFVLRAKPEFCEAAQFPDLCVIPTFHPAFLRRGAIHLSGVLARDIMRAVNVAKGRDKSFILDPPEPSHIATEIWDQSPSGEDWDHVEERAREAQRAHLSVWMQTHGLKYVLRPTPRDLDLFCRDVKARSDAWLAFSPDLRAASYLALSADIETRESASLDEDATDGFTDTIVEQIQFSVEPGQGIALAWTEDSQQASSWLLRLPLPKVGHNWWLFDQKVLRAVGARQNAPQRFLAKGDVHDTLQMFHYWQPDLPAHLQAAATFCQFPFPWKHLAGSNLPFYGCVDTDATLRVYLTARRTMEDRGIWVDPSGDRDNAGYVSQVQRLRPILADMEDRGLPVDNLRRLALDKEFDAAAAEVFQELDARFPDEARKIDPKEGYAGVPPAVKRLLGIRPKTKPKKGAVVESWPEPISQEEVSKVVFEKPGEKLEDGTREEGEFYRFIQQEFLGEVKWTRRFEFSPNSSQQLMRYMETKKHKVPTKKGGARTTEKKELERLAAKHHDNFYFKVIEFRELTKMRGTYIDGYRPHADGRVHTTFTFDTATGQLSSRNPNVQNTPKHGRLADAFRAIIRHPTKLIVEWDYKSFHVLTTGFEARCLEYMRLARLDMHSFIAWHFLKLPGADALYSLPDDELMAKLKWFKSDDKRKYVRDKQSKPAILGIGFGLGDEKFYNMNLEHFSSLAEAKKLRGLIKGMFPEVFKWQEQIIWKAHADTFLKSRYGSIRWIYEAKIPDGKAAPQLWRHPTTGEYFGAGFRNGEQAEQSIAFLPANHAFGHIRAGMRELERRGLCAKWDMMNSVHDSLLFLVDPSRMEEHCAEIYPILTAPSKVLIDPVLAPGGLSVDVEASAGVSWAKADLKELKINLAQMVS